MMEEEEGGEGGEGGKDGGKDDPILVVHPNYIVET